MLNFNSVFNPFILKEHQFAIKKVKVGATEKMIPVCREPGMKPRSWRPIVKVYDQYLIMDYEHPAGLSKRECEAHIKGLKKQIDTEKVLSAKSEELELVM